MRLAMIIFRASHLHFYVLTELFILYVSILPSSSLQWKQILIWSGSIYVKIKFFKWVVGGIINNVAGLKYNAVFHQQISLISFLSENWKTFPRNFKSQINSLSISLNRFYCISLILLDHLVLQVLIFSFCFTHRC